MRRSRSSRSGNRRRSTSRTWCWVNDASSGWHTHPGPEYSVVNKGTVQLRTAGNCVPAAFVSGQAIFIPAGVPHVVFNAAVEDAEAVVTYTLPADRPIRDDAPAACP